MTKASSAIKKVEVTNQNNLKPPQFNGKAGNTYLMWSMKFKANMVMKNLWEAFLPKFERKLPREAKIGHSIWIQKMARIIKRQF
jgi:hypothetical protein